MTKLWGVVAVLGLTAGAGSQRIQSNAVLVGPPTGMGCPVGLSAQRRAVGAVRLAGDEAPVAGGVRVLVGLEQMGAKRPVAATGELHGVPLGAGAMPAAAGAKGEHSELFTLQPKPGERLLTRAAVEPRRLQGVSWVELTQIQFADGTKWERSQTSRCVAEPNGVMLVSGH